jgi:hypothetical protein
MTFYLELTIDACVELGHLTWKILTYIRMLVIFATLRKVTIIFIVSVCLSACLSVRLEQFASHYMDFHDILYISIFRNPAEKIQV